MDGVRHLHFYTMKGRATSSMAIGGRALDPDFADVLSARVQFQIMEHGYSLRTWNEEEQAGLAVGGDQQFVLRVKSDGVVRDMRPGGIPRVLETIRRNGVDVDPILGVPEARIRDAMAARLGIDRTRFDEMSSTEDGQKRLLEMAQAVAR
jgi:hypothetical protein